MTSWPSVNPPSLCVYHLLQSGGSKSMVQQNKFRFKLTFVYPIYIENLWIYEGRRQCAAVMRREAVTVMPSCSGMIFIPLTVVRVHELFKRPSYFGSSSHGWYRCVKVYAIYQTLQMPTRCLYPYVTCSVNAVLRRRLGIILIREIRVLSSAYDIPWLNLLVLLCF